MHCCSTKAVGLDQIQTQCCQLLLTLLRVDREMGNHSHIERSG